MKKRIFFGVSIVVVLVAVGGILYYLNSKPFVATNNVQVRDVVYAFGDEISLVSLSGSSDEVAMSIDKHYAIYVHPDLLSSWKANHALAPGKKAGVPITDRIDIKGMEEPSKGTYVVSAELVSRATVSEFSRDVKTLPIQITVMQGLDGWQITEYKELTKWGS